MNKVMVGLGIPPKGLLVPYFRKDWGAGVPPWGIGKVSIFLANLLESQAIRYSSNVLLQVLVVGSLVLLCPKVYTIKDSLLSPERLYLCNASVYIVLCISERPTC